MTQEGFKKLLEQSGYPVSFEKFDISEDEDVKLPYLVWRIPDEPHFGADYKNLFVRYDIIVELYTDEKDIAVEKNIDRLLSEYEYEKHSTYLTDEQMQQTAYHLSIYEEE